MITSYLKTSVRNIVRNKLFSGINITGLAIGMSVGLLVITMVHDIFSYDRFNLKRDRIVRITTTVHSGKKDPEKFATSSVRAGEICKNNLPGVEDVAMLRRGFGGDAQVKKGAIPITGLWADGSVFNLFTFPLLKGDAKTALKEPYSIVLTEKTANRLFGKADVINQVIHLDSADYRVTGVMRNIPFFSHLQFEALASFSSLQQERQNDPEFLSWQDVSDNYTYLLLSENADISVVENSLLEAEKKENAMSNDLRITTGLLPLASIFLGEDLHNEIGHSLPKSLLWVVIVLALIAILTACFNYTNLSIARSLRRSREVGVRKVLGALKSQVMTQFVVESVIISLLSLVFAIVIFFSLRSAFLSLGPSFATLQLSPVVVVCFVVLATIVGVMAGLLPAVSLSGVNPLQVLKNTQSLKLFRYINLRKALIFTQYAFSLFFVATTIIIYRQYDFLTSQDLGFETENIINISLQGNDANRLKDVISQIPEAKQISQSKMISSLGPGYSGYTRSEDPRDSVVTDLNSTDENYIPLHAYKLLAGRNFLPAANQSSKNEIVINESLVKYFNIGAGDPQQALGQSLISDGKSYQIVGVVQDFHYNSLYSRIRPALIRYKPSDTAYLNVKVRPGAAALFISKIGQSWKKIDPVHPLTATIYQDDIMHFYKPLSFISKIIGSLAFLTIFIASMGLFGMVVFTVETRIREISIRKVLGASERRIVYMLSKGFLSLLALAALLALATSSFLFNQFITMVAYHAPIPLFEIGASMIAFMFLAFLIVSSETLGAARSNPAQVLKSE
jgi:putative ABC transport system permease protein